MQKPFFNIILLHLLCMGLSLYCMKRGATQPLQITQTKQLRKYSFDLPFLITNEIFRLGHHIARVTTSLDETIFTINSLSYLNKSYKKKLEDRTPQTIQELACLYHCSHMYITQRLQTESAKERYKLQNLLFTNLNGTYYVFNERHCNFVKQSGFDFEFTFNINNSTPLIIAAGQKAYAFQSLTEWLIKNGANINAKNSLGMNAAMAALRTMNESAALNLLERPGIDINQKDYFDNTLFHYLCMGFNQYYYPCGLTIDNLYQWWKNLMKKKLDPLLKNKQEKTAFDLLAYEHGRELIALLIENK